MEQWNTYYFIYISVPNVLCGHCEKCARAYFASRQCHKVNPAHQLGNSPTEAARARALLIARARSQTSYESARTAEIDIPNRD